jgi:hypothetical protein
MISIFKYYCCLNFFLIYFIGNCQTIFHHKCEITDPGDFIIVQWNIASTLLPEAYIEEKVDAKGRTLELRYYFKGSLIYPVECGVYQLIRYEYPSDTVICEMLFDCYGDKESNIECGVPWKTTYYLSKDQRMILRTEYENYVDTLFYLKHGMTMKQIESALEDLKREKYTSDCVSYYCQSKAKLNGIFPISRDFNINNYFYNEAEKSEIERIIKKK